MKTSTKVVFEVVDRMLKNAPDSIAMLSVLVTRDGEVLYSAHGTEEIMRRVYDGVGMQLGLTAAQEIDKWVSRDGEDL